MPTRSSGCLTCRRRKIRCDESRPGCQRCETHGVPCPGYRTEKPGGIEFKDQTNVTRRKADKQYQARLALRAAEENGSKGGASHLASSTTTFMVEDLDTWMNTPNSSTSSDSSPSTIDLDEFPNKKQSLVLKTNRGPSARNRAGFAISSIPQLHSPDVERVSLYSKFIATYLPKVQQHSENGHFSFFESITRRRPTEPSLQQGLDALALVQIGSLYKDRALLRQAVRQYGNAVSSLGRSITKGQFLHDDDILSSVTVLATCELFEEINTMGPGSGWGHHVEGANRLVALRGPDSLQSDTALLLYSNMRHGSLLHALIERKAPFMDTPEWRAVAYRVPRAVKDESTNFYDAAIQIPGLLERHDALDLDSPNALHDLDAILADAIELEDALRDWFAAWQAIGSICSNSGSDTPYYELRPIQEFELFSSLCSDRTLTHAYWFPDFLIAYLHSLYWMVMFYLRTNTQSLQKHRHRLDHDWYPDTSRVVEEDELLGYIFNLCQCMPFFVEPISSSTGSVGIFLPLRCAAIYFTAHGHWQWLKWIGSVRNSVFVKGLVPPNVRREGPPSAP